MVSPMQYEIAIQGLLPDIAALYGRMPSSWSRLEKTVDPSGAVKGTIFMKASGRYIDDRLYLISGIINSIWPEKTAEPDLDVHVRNLAASEPSSGSDQYRLPFEPIPGLTIQPWQEGAVPVPGRQTLILDPDYAFGTGKHPTTRLCLDLLGQLAGHFVGRRVLDLGCGTGLLAMAAVKMGAAGALGLDVDRRAVAAARRNVSLNGLAGQVEIRLGSAEAAAARYDLVTANLVTSVLLNIGKNIPPLMSEHGLAIVSGFGEGQVEMVREFFTGQGLEIRRQLTLEGWGAFLISGQTPVNR